MDPETQIQDHLHLHVRVTKPPHRRGAKHPPPPLKKGRDEAAQDSKPQSPNPPTIRPASKPESKTPWPQPERDQPIPKTNPPANPRQPQPITRPPTPAAHRDEPHAGTEPTNMPGPPRTNITTHFGKPSRPLQAPYPCHIRAFPNRISGPSQTGYQNPFKPAFPTTSESRSRTISSHPKPDMPPPSRSPSPPLTTSQPR